MKTLHILLLALSATSCSRAIPAATTAVHSDSKTEHAISGDTLVVRDSVIIKSAGDTVSETRVKTVYRSRIERDTVTICVTDTVPVIVEVEKAASPQQSFLATMGRYAIGALISIAALLLLRHRNLP